ncbi:MAG TPA: tyrosine-type recombinase/integrase [Terracidiphilus sp.]|nr:tyrosine-type recombinase/integrase [Terracidiphilus sp.]
MLITRPPVVIMNQPVPFAEKMQDHTAILDAFLDTHVVGIHSHRTWLFDKRYFRGFFDGYKFRADQEATGQPLFIWDAMHPIIGPTIINSYCTGLAETDLKRRTCISYLRRLNALFRHVVANPHIPTRSIRDRVLISEKYNAIANPISKYIYPPPKATDDSAEGLLLEEDLNNFLHWISRDYLPTAPLSAGRTYTMIVVVSECGFRFCELEGLDALQPTRDIIADRRSIRTRFGKAAHGSGPRPRQVELTPMARDTLKHYEQHIRPKFPNAATEPALFMSEAGSRIGYWEAKSDLETIVQHARIAGLVLPADMGWHSFRRSFATQFLQRHPDQIWKLLDLMGHEDSLSLIRYVRLSAQEVNRGLGRVLVRLKTRRIA